MKRYLLILLTIFASTIACATVNLQITPDNARPGETIRLIFTQKNTAQSQGTPDLTPLQKEFTLIGTEHSLSYRANNGVATSENEWVVLLIPKKTGTLTIPPIKIGHEYSPERKITILSSSAKMPVENDSIEPPEENSAVTLESEVDLEKPFINQQIIYTVKLATNQSLLEAQYQPPRVENALLIPLGEGRRYQTTTDGQEYSVDEQRYAIYPQKSGLLNIIPPKLSAVVYKTMPERIQAEGKDIQLMVKPTPQTDTNNAWLPAKQLSISEQYDSSETTMKQGSTLVRKITVQAMGLPAELLPAMPFPDNTQYNVYPEKPDTRNVLRHQELVGTSTVTVTYILNQAGNITLPSIKLPWYNTQTGQNELASLPNHELKVTSRASKKHTSLPSVKKSSHPIIKQPAAQTLHMQSRRHGLWTTILFALAGIITLVAGWWLHRRSVKPRQSQRTTRSDLRKSCAKNNPEQAHSALLAWGRQQWPKTALLNLNELSKQVNNIELKKQIALLTEALYSRNGEKNWQGKALWQAVKNYRPSPMSSTTTKKPLPPINPVLSEVNSKTKESSIK